MIKASIKLIKLLSKNNHTNNNQHIPNIFSFCLSHNYIEFREFAIRKWKSPGFQSAAYLGICFGLPYIVPSPWKGNDLWSQTANSIAGAGVLGTLTWLFSRTSNGTEVQPTYSGTQAQLVKFSTGLILGCIAFSIVVITARTRQWVVFEGWGWQQTSIENLSQTMTLLALKHIAVAGAEELVFRGYGFQVLEQAVGTTFASAILTGVFSIAHGFESQSLLGQGALGIALVSLRLAGNSWLVPFGYHFAWNYIQTAIVGPPAWPSLHTIVIQGPYQWIGRPGYPEPGMLTTLVNFGVAMCTAAVFLHVRKRNHSI